MVDGFAVLDACGELGGLRPVDAFGAGQFVWPCLATLSTPVVAPAGAFDVCDAPQKEPFGPVGP